MRIFFYHNQRLIKEHREREDRQNVQEHLSRVLEEVKEGKRKFFNVAAHPEFSAIPREIPLDKSLAVTVAYKPKDLHFNIMSQESQTGSMSAPTIVRAKVLPYEALQYTSTITKIDQISAILKKHGLKIYADLALRVPHSDERSCHAPKGSDKLQLAAWSQEHLRTGVLLPLRPYFRNFLYYKNSPLSITNKRI